MDHNKPSFGMVEVSIQLDSDWWYDDDGRPSRQLQMERPWDQKNDKIASSNNHGVYKVGPLPVIHGVIRC